MTAALIPVDPVSAVAVDAGVGKALVDVVLAILSICAKRTSTSVTAR